MRTHVVTCTDKLQDIMAQRSSQYTPNCSGVKFYIPAWLFLCQFCHAPDLQSWSLYRDDRRRINTTEMDAIRRSAGISKLDRKMNEYIREKMNAHDIG